MASTGRADVAGTVPTIVAKGMQKYTMPRLEFWKRINHHDREANVGDRVQIPTYNTRPSTTQLHTGTDTGFSGSAEADFPLAAASYSNQTVGSTTVYVSNWYYVAIDLTEYAQAVAQGDLSLVFKQAGLDALAVQIDTSVAALVTGFTTYDRGTLGSPVTDDVVVGTMSDLDTAQVEGTRHFIFSELTKADFFQIERYVNNLYRDGKPISKGDLGSLYGMEWAWTTQVHSPGVGQHNNIAFHPEAIGGIMRKRPMARIADVPDPMLSERIVSSAIWGVNETRDGFAVRVRGR